ncbi:MAG: hypothetical protein HEQ35_05175 [Gloeotrichia echinulata IR180]
MKPGTFLMKFPMPSALFWYLGLLTFYTLQTAVARRKPIFAITTFFKALTFFPIFIRNRQSMSQENALRWLNTRAEYQEKYYKRINQWTWFRKYIPAVR